MIGAVASGWSNHINYSRINNTVSNAADLRNDVVDIQTSQEEAASTAFNQDESTEADATFDNSKATAVENGADEAFTEEEQREVDYLKQRDAEVKKHEQAHLAVAGQYARGGASFEYEVGPNGKRYAVGGEVQIDISQGRTPEETLQKALIVRQAALAPAEPSNQDRQVAAKAASMAQSARREIAEEQQQKNDKKKPAKTSAEESNIQASTETGEARDKQTYSPQPRHHTVLEERGSINNAPTPVAKDNVSHAIQESVLENIASRNKPFINPASRKGKQIYQGQVLNPHAEGISSQPGGVTALSIAI
jgi:hypothetical protein